MKVYWAKVWTDILGDVKLTRAARKGAKGLELLPWIIVFAKSCDAEGALVVGGEPAEAEDIAPLIPGVTTEYVVTALQSLLDVGVLVRDEGGVVALAKWEQRNESPPSAGAAAVKARVAKHRRKKRGVDAPEVGKPAAPAEVTPAPVAVSVVAPIQVDPYADHIADFHHAGRRVETAKIVTEVVTPLVTAPVTPVVTPPVVTRQREEVRDKSKERTTGEPPSATPAVTPPPEPKPVTLVTQCGEAWSEVLGAANYGRVGEAVKKVRRTFADATDAEILSVFTFYVRWCEAVPGEAKFANPQEWAAKYAVWKRRFDKASGSVSRARVQETQATRKSSASAAVEGATRDHALEQMGGA